MEITNEQIRMLAKDVGLVGKIIKESGQISINSLYFKFSSRFSLDGLLLIVDLLVRTKHVEEVDNFLIWSDYEQGNLSEHGSGSECNHNEYTTRTSIRPATNG